MTVSQLSFARALATIGSAPLILAGVQTVLLYLTMSGPVLNLLYGNAIFWQIGAQRLVPLVAALVGVANFVLPVSSARVRGHGAARSCWRRCHGGSPSSRMRVHC